MDAGSSTEARKRKRPSARQSDSARRLPSSSPLEVSKRRRLDDNEPPQQPKSPLRVLKSAIGSIGGALGLGRTKDSSPMESQSDRENLPRRKPRKALHELYQNDVDELAPAGVKYLPATAQPKSGTRKSSGAAKEPPQEDGTPVPSSQTRLKRPRRSRGTVEPGVDNGEIEAASPTATDSIQGEADTAAAFTGRPSLQERELKLLRTELVEYEDSRETPPRSETPNISARSSGRERRRPRRYSNEMLKDVVTKPKSILTPSKGRVGRVKKTVGFGEDTSSTRMSTVEPAGSPDLDTMETDVVETPTKPKRSRTRKITSESPAESLKGVPRTPKLKGASVDLDEEVDAIKDETSAKRTKQLKRPSGKVKPTKSPSPEDVDMIDVETAAVTKEEDDDDIKCVICGGANSEPPNEIVLCDNCDLAAHQACYDVPVIPEGDWLCRDCRTGGDDEELSLIETTRLDIGGKDIPDIEELEFHLQVTQKLILDKLTGRRRLKLVGLDEEYQKVHQVVEQTVLAGEGNSMLVIGARGSGKSALVENVIDALSTDHRDDFYVVRLSGFIHTDDKLALREIWRQLGREMEIDESETSKTNNYADTLSTLLALLSHPSEMGEAEDNQTTKSIVFVLDEFDLFAYHPRQTLLYNLFDIAQARKAPIAVLGLTTKIDVVESLEKRVKSRFSHRYVHLPLSRSLAAFWEICRQGLTIDMNELVEEGYDPGVPGIDKFLSYWTSMVDTLYLKDLAFKHHLQTAYYRHKSIPTFLTTAILPISLLSPRTLPITGRSFLPGVGGFGTFSPPDSKLHLLPSLAELDLSLLVAAARLSIIHDIDTCNFAMAYDEYSSLVSKHKIRSSAGGTHAGIGALGAGAGAKVWGREVALRSWERLVDGELLITAGLGAGTGGAAGGAGGALAGREGGMEFRMWRVDVALDEIPDCFEGGLGGMVGRWCREI